MNTQDITQTPRPSGKSRWRWLAWTLLVLSLLLAPITWAFTMVMVTKAVGLEELWFPTWSLTTLLPASSLGVFLYTRLHQQGLAKAFGIPLLLVITLIQATGLGQRVHLLATATARGPYSSRREYGSTRTPMAGWLAPQVPVIYDLGSGVRLAMPLTCFVDGSRHTLPLTNPDPLPTPVTDGSTRPLTNEGLANLVAFTRAFGYLRFFHPSDQAAAADWNRLALLGVRAVEDATSPEDLARKLQTFFSSIAPTVQFLAPATPTKSISIPKEARELVRWNHTGVGPLPPGHGTFDRSMRLGDVVLLWTVMQHFYPYFDVIQVDLPDDNYTSPLTTTTNPHGE